MSIWSKIPHWLKGSIIADVLTFLSAILIFSCGLLAPFMSEPEQAGWACLPITLLSPLLPFEILSDKLPFLRNPVDLISMSMVAWFIIGASIGGLIGVIIRYKKRSGETNVISN